MARNVRAVTRAVVAIAAVIAVAVNRSGGKAGEAGTNKETGWKLGHVIAAGLLRTI